MRQWLASLALAAMLSVLLAPGAAAGEQWCEDDPPVVITTPRGAHVVVYVTSGAQGVEHLVAVQLASISYTATSIDGGRATLVRMAVTIPPDQFASSFATRSTVSTGPYKTLDQLATAWGRSGKAMRLEFKLVARHGCFDELKLAALLASAPEPTHQMTPDDPLDVP